MGMNTGMKISSTEIQSRMKPATKHMNRKTASVAQGDRSAALIRSSASQTPPEATNTPANMLPPRRMRMIMQVTLRVFMAAS